MILKKESGSSQPNHFKMLATEQPSEETKKSKSQRAKEKEKDRINSSSREQANQIKQVQKGYKKGKMRVIHPGQGGTN